MSQTQATRKALQDAIYTSSEYVTVRTANQGFSYVTKQVPQITRAIADSVKEKPSAAAGFILAATGLTVLAVPTVVSAPALVVFGFGSGGVGAGTIAAAAQSSIGNVVAGSIFATVQSAGAGGVGLVAVNGAVQVGGGVLTTIRSGLALRRSKL